MVRFQDDLTTSKQLRKKEMFYSPFTCSVDSAATDLHLELIEIQSGKPVAEQFKSVPLLNFYSSFKE